MSLIHAQIKFEKEYAQLGYDQYKEAVNKAIAEGHASTVASVQKLIRNAHRDIADDLTLRVKVVKRGKRAAALQYFIDRKADPDVVAYVALHVAIQRVLTSEDAPLVQVADAIGRALDDDLRFRSFSKDNAAYYKAVAERYKQAHSKSVRHRRNALVQAASSQGHQWPALKKQEVIMLGLYMLDLLSEHGVVTTQTVARGRNKAVRLVVLTDECEQWLDDDVEFRAVLHPITPICIAPPLQWRNQTTGGFYTKRLQREHPLVGVLRRHRGIKEQHTAIIEEAIGTGTMDVVIEAVNRVQATRWQINKKVLAAYQFALDMDYEPLVPSKERKLPGPFLVDGRKPSDDELKQPEIAEQFTEWKRKAATMYTEDKARSAKAFKAYAILRTALQYSEYANIWFVNTLDFRSRMYSHGTNALTPQGNDIAKALLRFGEGKPLGPMGDYWLMVHGANSYGVDKVTFAERIRWVRDNEDWIVELGINPQGHLGRIAEADSPWQFLAFACEYAAMRQCRDHSKFISHLPVGQDGTCNGLQHYSAILRDPIGAQYVNLAPNARPSDIYRRVAEVCQLKVRGRNTQYWADIEITRGLAKRPVMTLPYGSTLNSCGDYIREWIIENQSHPKEHGWAAAYELRPILWDSIGEVVSGARACMDWFKVVCATLAAAGYPFLWYTPTGFPLFQKYPKMAEKRVDTALLGRIQMQIRLPVDGVDTRKMRNSIAPNIVHSLDAGHLQLTVCSMPPGTSFAMVHDSYGTHACDIPLLRDTLRAAFVELHSYDILWGMHAQLTSLYGVDLPIPPEVGDFDINLVLSSDYFFN